MNTPTTNGPGSVRVGGRDDVRRASDGRGDGARGLRAVVVSTDAKFRDTLGRLMGSDEHGVALEIETAVSLAELTDGKLDTLRRIEPDVVFLDLERDPGEGLRMAELLLDASLARIVVGADTSPSSDFLMTAMGAGVSEFLAKPLTPDDVRRVLVSLRRKWGLGAGRSGERRARIIGVLSPKGEGATTVATNLAVAIRRLTGEPTLLMDLDVEMGDTTLLLGMEARFSVLDLLRNLHRLDAGLLASLVERHDSGLDVLPAPQAPVTPETLAPDQVEECLTRLERHYEYLVLDLPGTMSPMCRAAIRRAHELYLLVTGELRSLRGARRCQALLEEMGEPADGDACRLLVNRFEAGQLISLEEIERGVGRDVFATLANDHDAVIRAHNNGRPLAGNDRSPLAADVRSLAGRITGVHAEDEGRSRWRERLLSPLRAGIASVTQSLQGEKR